MKKENIILIGCIIIIFIAIAFYRGYFDIRNEADASDAVNIISEENITNSSVIYANISRTSASSAYAIDGDTLKAWIDGKEYTIRMIGINAPEKGQYYHDEATDKLKEMIAGKNVSLESDVGVPDKDIYGRLLRYAIINDNKTRRNDSEPRRNTVNINLELLRGGYARYYPLNQTLRYAKEFSDAEQYAKSQNIGLWSKANTSCIGITIFNYNPAGDDRNNSASEYVTFKNSCEEFVNITGYTVTNKELAVFEFSSRSLASGAKITLHTGKGEDDFSKYNSDVYWNKTKPMWANKGDRLVMYDMDGAIVLDYSYG